VPSSVEDLPADPSLQLLEQYHPHTGLLLQRYNSLREAADKMRISTAHDIFKCCSGQFKSVVGFVWMFCDRLNTGEHLND
jgi:hypothetical protein